MTRRASLSGSCDEPACRPNSVVLVALEAAGQEELAMSLDDAPSELKAPTFDEMVEGIRRGVAEAVREAHALGLPVFESDNRAVYAIYPDGRRVVVEHLLGGRRMRSVAEPDHT